MRVAIMGAGSLGTIIGALMNHHGKAVDLIDVSQENVDALNASGATITGEGKVVLILDTSELVQNAQAWHNPGIAA